MDRPIKGQTALIDDAWKSITNPNNILVINRGEKHYIYHSPTNSILDPNSNASKLLFRVSSKLVNSPLDLSKSDTDSVKQLIALEGINRIRLEDAKLPIAYLAISPTLGCNLRCTYCYNFQEGAEEKIRSTPQLEKPAISKILATLGEMNVNKKINLAFIGGEPFLYPRLLDKLARFARNKAREHDKELTLLVTTNGLSLGKKTVAKSILRNDIRVSISLDGPPIWHDQTRKLLSGNGSSGAVMAGIDAFFKYYPHNIRAARATYKLEPGRLLATYKFLRDTGFNDISTGSHEFETGRLDGSIQQELFSEIDSLAAEIESDFITGKIVRHAWFTEVISNLYHGRVKDVICGATRNHVAFDTYGKMQACHRYLGNEEYELSANDINNPATSNLINEIRAPGKTKHCTDCWARSLCGGECFHVGKEIMKQQDNETRQRFLCDYKRKKYEAAVQMFIRLAENHPAILERVVNPLARP